ncbi:hypothetical protein [Oscillibacter sp. 1-3]|uniref:hypothetical protein n=1 Tax=Oscillibacter sp. 1-3 TaxID=1235797 RepID=UPI0018CAA3E9|nr:hypothetical protein [Oscillibacter sp. 1-3]
MATLTVKFPFSQNRFNVCDILRHLTVPFLVCQTDKISHCLRNVLFLLMIPERMCQNVKAFILSGADNLFRRFPPSPAAVGEVFEILKKRLPIGIHDARNMVVRFQGTPRRPVHGNGRDSGLKERGQKAALLYNVLDNFIRFQGRAIKCLIKMQSDFMTQRLNAPQGFLPRLSRNIIKIRSQQDEIGGTNARIRFQLRQLYRLGETVINVVPEDNASADRFIVVVIPKGISLFPQKRQKIPVGSIGKFHLFSSSPISESASG